MTNRRSRGRAPSGAAIEPADAIARRIHVLRGERVMLDEDLAVLYGVPSKVLNQAVHRNRSRFPDDFAFQVTAAEFDSLRSQIVTSNAGRGGRRYRPYAFTEQGVAMVSSVLRSPRAVAVNILIMRAFVQLRRAQGQYAELQQSVEELARRVEGHDELLAHVLEALNALEKPPQTRSRPLGFRPAREDLSRPRTRHRIGGRE